jgi:hypothetical protein
MPTETRAKATTPASSWASPTYSRVVIPSTATERRNETRLPSVSAITPVGISNRTIPAEKAAFATNTSKKLRPASSRKSVFTPQIAAAESVYRPASVK